MADVVFVLLLAFAWGCYWPAMKLALQEVDVWLFRTGAGLGGGLMFLLALKVSGCNLNVPKSEWWPLLLTTLLNMTLFPLCSLLALRFYAAGAAVIIAYSMPVWVAILSTIVLGERLSRRRVAALGLGMLGLSALMVDEVRDAGGLPAGALLVLLGALIWASGVVMQKRVAWKAPIAVLTGWQLILGTIPLLPVSLALSDLSVFRRISAAAALAWGYSAFIGFAVGYYLFYRIVARLPATVASMTSLAVPVVGVLASAVMLGERIGRAELLGLISIVAAVGLVLFERKVDGSTAA